MCHPWRRHNIMSSFHYVLSLCSNHEDPLHRIMLFDSPDVASVACCYPYNATTWLSQCSLGGASSSLSAYKQPTALDACWPLLSENKELSTLAVHRDSVLCFNFYVFWASTCGTVANSKIFCSLLVYTQSTELSELLSLWSLSSLFFSLLKFYLRP